MNAFENHLAAQLDRKLRDRRIVVWYDPRSEFTDFVAGLESIEPPEGRGSRPVR